MKPAPRAATSTQSARCSPASRGARVSEALQLHILGPHFQALILVLPHRGRIEFKQPGRELTAGLCQQPFRFFRRAFVSVVVVAGGLALPVVPVGDGVDRKSTRLNSSHLGISY